MSECMLDHVHIYSENVEQTIEYYKCLFHAVELRRISNDQGELIHLSLGSSRIVVSTATKEKPAGIHHLAIAVEQFDEKINELMRQGCRFETEITNNGIYRNVFFRDPNQILIELINPSTK